MTTAGARTDQQAPLDRDEELGFQLMGHGEPWKAPGRGCGVNMIRLESSGSAVQYGLSVGA